MTNNRPWQVAVVMGNPFDLQFLQPAIDLLCEFGVEVRTRFISAHKTPRETLNFGASASEQGYSVIIAGAGGAAHLPGMLASATSLPVIGVPIAVTKFQGLDSLLAMVQTPPGVPVATVAVDSGVNAAVLALKILAISDASLADALDTYRESLAAAVRASNAEGKNARGGEGCADSRRNDA